MTKQVQPRMILAKTTGNGQRSDKSHKKIDGEPKNFTAPQCHEHDTDKTNE
ncbi:hypothetical protein KBI23_25685 [bacterium]|nr:hypothetical protein [bacterium]MBP9811086.1 hypothetical protein [bacterium]